MAYKQTPGRGNSTKTGSGISPTLMGGSPMKQKDPKKMKRKGPFLLTNLVRMDSRGFSSIKFPITLD